MHMDTSLKKTVKPTISRKNKSTGTQAAFLRKLGELLAEGFYMKDALDFLQITLPGEATWIEQVKKGLEIGNRLDEELKKIGFSQEVTAQLFLAHTHGHLTETLIGCGKQLESRKKKEKELKALLQYPALLLLFLVGMLLSMRFILLPHLSNVLGGASDSGHWLSGMAVSFVYYSPYWLLVLLVGILLGRVILQESLRQKTALEKASFYCKWPFFSSFFRLYYTHQMAQEWSLLFKSGMTIQEIIQLMKNESATSLMQEMGRLMESTLMEGFSFNTSLETFDFLLPELGFIILHGESTGKLEKELSFFSEDCLHELGRKTQKSFQYVQPLLFLLIAILIISIYAALLLPMFSIVKEIG